MDEVAQPEQKDFDPDTDFLPVIFARWATLGVELPVTVTTGGTVITGIVTSANAYFKQMSDGFRGDGSDTSEIRDMLCKVFDNLADQTDTRNLSEQEKDDLPDPVFLHLRDASIAAPGQPLFPASKLAWRVRINRIDAISIGQLQQVD